MHEKFIDQLGGYHLLAKHLGLKQNRVRMWRVRGIAWTYRPTIARLAAERGIPIPQGFLDAEAA